MAAGKHPVSTAAIQKEIKRALAKLKAKKKKASAAQMGAINTEMEVLTKVKGVCGDIKPF